MPRTLKVTDRTGRSPAAEVQVLVGNAEPVVELITTPAPDAPFQFGDTVTYEVKVTDDTPVDCTKLTVAFVLGHETHGHPSPRPAAAPARSRRSSTPATPERRTSAPCSSPRTRARAARRA